MKITTVVDVKTLNSLSDNEKIEAFAKINNRDLETLIHYAQIELQERELVENEEAQEAFNDAISDAEEEQRLGEQTAQERRIWL